METRTFAQKAIFNKIGEKRKASRVIQDVDGYVIEPGYIEHVDYSEGSPCPQE